MSSKNFYGLTGDVTIDGGILNVGNAQLYANTETSNVGIGTTNPGFTLDVNGDANVGVLYSTFLHGDGSNIENIVSSQWEGSPGNPIYYTSNVGISNTEVVTKTLQIGSNLFVEETGSNVLYVTGNVYASRFVGDGSLLTGIAASLDDIVDQGNVVSNTIILESGIDPVSNIGLVTKEGVAISISNVNPTGEFQLGVGSNLLVNVYSSNVLTVDGNVFAQKMTLGTVTVTPSYNLEQITTTGATSGQSMSLTNATTGLTTTANIVVGGNVTATSVIITSNIEVGGNVNANTVITTANIEVGGNAQLQGGVALGGHIIPTVDNTYDIGSAAFKIRDMYVSDNSLWIGDDTKLSVTGGELKFRKRNTGVVPKGITDMGGTSGAALTHAGVSDINDMKLHHWESYAKSVDATKTTKDIFTDDAENYETSAIKTFNTSNAMTIGTTKTFAAVCTEDASGGLKYYIDGYLQASLALHQGQTYIFDLSSPTLVDHPFVFQTTNANDGTTDGTNYTSGITTTGGYGSTEKRTFVVPVGAPTTLYYYCTAHSGMGGSVSISSEAELIVSGGAEFLGTGTIKVPSGTTDQRPATGINGMLRYNSQTGYMEAYTVSGWGSIATPPTIQTISPVSVAVSAVTTQVFTVTGAFFDAQTTIQLQGADSTKYDVTDFVFTNSGSIGFKMGTLASGQAANRPYKVVVTNGAGLTATSTATIGFSGLSWTTQTLNPYYTGPSSTQNLVATDEVGGNNVTFSIYSGSVSGLSLGSTGASPATYGGSTSSTGTTPVTFRVTDNVTGSTLDKTLSIVVQTPPTGEAVFTQPTSSTSWTVPAGVTSISAVVVGGGAGGMHAPQNGVGSAGGGGGLTYANQFSVTPGETLTVVAGKGGNGGIKISSVVAEDGGHSYIQRATTNINLIIAYSGAVDKSLVTVTSSAGIGGVGGGSVTNVSYQGGNGAPSETTQKGTRGAGQGGYGDDGGIATIVRGGGTNPSGGGTNGGGAGGYGVATTVGKGGGCSGSGGGGGGGGVNLYGTSTGTLPSSVNLDGSPGGLGGASSAHGQPGGGFGGGGGSADDAATQGGGDGGDGAVRIIWGPGRSFPSTNVGQSSSLGNVTYY